MERGTETSLRSGPQVLVVPEPRYELRAQPQSVIEGLRLHGIRVHALSLADGPIPVRARPLRPRRGPALAGYVYAAATGQVGPALARKAMRP
jgi:hypothetical protein